MFKLIYRPDLFKDFFSLLAILPDILLVTYWLNERFMGSNSVE